MTSTPPAQLHTRLRVFLATARHLSFTRAGEELHITTGAVSQQIKLLENWLGQRLFRRLPRRIELTDAGNRLLAAVDPAYSAVDLAIGRLRNGALSGVVRLRALPSFLTTWLVPRLPGLMKSFPQIELQAEAEDSTHSLRDGDFDLAIDLNDGIYPGFQSTVLLEEEIFPVCSPRLLDGRPPLVSPEDLRHYPLLHDMTAWRGSPPYAEWERYLRAIGAPQVEVRRGYMFNRNHITMQCAIAGMGVAIARRTLITDELDSGRLVAPFRQSVPTGKRYCLVYSSGALADPRIASVHDWVVREARGSAEPLPRGT
ncbi:MULTISPECIES: LysR substrate-binding domain-containing protein [unclassified Thauera]|uniref:LysR substrate-binding domain-containing protein n=1 Tax=unclassified Thauera TaxID=2609274 RepID=UPI0021E132DC|nr:LysR substrate-binding domain-containing protein [Thauera sp. Sel9]MCV2218848.1 LysR substrate-binding domain-containing protein [Thauera sp. Sel9]